MLSYFAAWLAALLTCILLVPHAVAAYQGETVALSQRTIAIIFAATLMWTFHGFVQGDPALMFAGPITLASSGVILYKKLHRSKGSSSRAASRPSGRSTRKSSGRGGSRRSRSVR